MTAIKTVIAFTQISDIIAVLSISTFIIIISVLIIRFHYYSEEIFGDKHRKNRRKRGKERK